MSFSKSKAALAVAGVMALGAAGQAQAGAYAASYLDINNLVINFGDPSAVSINSFLYTLTNTASLNGAASPLQTVQCGGSFPTGTCSLASPTLDAAPANAPGGTVTRTNNTFIKYGPGTDTYSNSDSVIYDSQLTLDAVTHTRQVAESEVQSTGSGAANAEIQSTSGITLTFDVVGTVTSLTLSFLGDPYLEAMLSDPNFLSGNAQANLNTSFTLTKGLTEISWSPQGNATNNCDVTNGGSITCVENNDSSDLNLNPSVAANGDSFIYDPVSGLFGITITGLTAGTWSLALNSLTSTQIQLETVPEPGSLALLGLALAGLGLTSIRRKQA